MSVLIYGDRVRQARTLRYVSSGDLAEHVGWRSDKQSRLEGSHEVVIEEDELTRLVGRLRFPAAFFTTPPVSPLHENDLLFRAPAATTKREKRYLKEFARAADEMLAFIDQRAPMPAVKLPRRDTDDIPAGALAVRESLGYHHDEPIPHLTHKVERAGVPVVVRRGLTPGEGIESEPGSTNLEKHNGYSTWVGEFREQPLIVTRSLRSWERTRWTIAHEVGHLYLHRTAVSPQAENEASQFASELLAPHQEIAKDLPKHVTLATLLDIKMRWGISIGALIPHLHQHDLISDQRFKTLRLQIYTRKNPESGHTWGMQEPGFDAHEPERPRLLSKWMERALSTSHASAVAAVPGVIYPPDVLADMTSGQRPAPSKQPRPGRSARAASARHETPRETELAQVFHLTPR